MADDDLTLPDFIPALIVEGRNEVARYHSAGAQMAAAKAQQDLAEQQYIRLRDWLEHYGVDLNAEVDRLIAEERRAQVLRDMEGINIPPVEEPKGAPTFESTPAKPPTVKQFVIDVLTQIAPVEGPLAPARMRALYKQIYGLDVRPKTLTITLGRMVDSKLISRNRDGSGYCLATPPNDVAPNHAQNGSAANVG